MALEGLHHVTAITAGAPRNVGFYARVLGQRLMLPARHESRRDDLDAALTPITNPRHVR